MIKAVIFDLDGTLVNSLFDLAAACNYALTEKGFHTHTIEEYKYFIGNGIPKLIERAVPENHRNEHIIKAVREEFLRYYSVHFVDKTVAYDGMMETVTELKDRGLKLAVVTNKADNMAKSVVKAVYGDIFDIVLGLTDKFPAKPEAASTLNVLKQLSVTADECVFVGDSAVDIITANNAGLKSVGVLWGFRKREELAENGATYIIEKPQDLLEIIG
ncbi:MAG: HAD-IIIA family hydrolase [Clostridia bacterium]|nr:HAD-IIIA family hydrolase [Clostridia bacterium]